MPHHWILNTTEDLSPTEQANTLTGAYHRTLTQPPHSERYVVLFLFSLNLQIVLFLFCNKIKSKVKDEEEIHQMTNSSTHYTGYRKFDD
jgi:hypothetical protein